jgi:uncharacterized membrane protein YukC
MPWFLLFLVVKLLQEVRSGLNDDYEFVVSPDAFRFTALKVLFVFHWEP